MSDYEGMRQWTTSTTITMHVSCHDIRGSVTRKYALFRIMFTVCVLCSFEKMRLLPKAVLSENDFIQKIPDVHILYRKSPITLIFLYKY